MHPTNSSDFLIEWLKSGTLFSLDNNEVLIGFGKRTWMPHPHSFHPSFYFPDYFLESETPWFEHEYHCKLEISKLLEFLANFPTDTIRHFWRNPYQTLFNRTFADLQKKFSEKILVKAVPFVSELTDEGMNQNQLIHSLKTVLNYALSHSVYLYGFWSSEEGILGATPEILFQVHEHNKLETMACAGTNQQDVAIASFLLNSKERSEHELVIQGIKESLSPYGKVTVEQLHLLSLSSLVHLVTPIHVEMHASLSFQEAVKALHPTPAVGAFPRKPGKLWLKEYQQHIQRKRFAAPVGYFNPSQNQSRCLVAIRNVQWDQHHMNISAGCGIVVESQCDEEWSEINLKLNAIKKMLAL
jgi:menaquinone-specific isochorismate synthase